MYNCILLERECEYVQNGGREKVVREVLGILFALYRKMEGDNVWVDLPLCPWLWSH
jgi:hypothetical protein